MVPFELQPVADGVHAAIAAPGAGAQGNAAIVDLGDRTLVFDTFLTPAAGAALRQAAERLTGRAPTLVVNSHWHADHVLGNQAFAPGAAFVSTAATRELMLAHPLAERLPAQLAGLEEQLAGEADEAVRAALAETLAEGRHLQAALPGLRRVYPDVLLDRALTLQGSERRAEVRCPGGGHTRSDVVVHLPEDRVVLAGDLVMAGVMPLAVHGDVAEWRRILDELRALEAERIVPGHGPAGGPADLELTGQYLAFLADVTASEDEAALRTPLPRPFSRWSHGVAHAANVRALLSATPA